MIKQASVTRVAGLLHSYHRFGHHLFTLVIAYDILFYLYPNIITSQLMSVLICEPDNRLVVFLSNWNHFYLIRCGGLIFGIATFIYNKEIEW